MRRLVIPAGLEPAACGLGNRRSDPPELWDLFCILSLCLKICEAVAQRTALGLRLEADFENPDLPRRDVVPGRALGDEALRVLMPDFGRRGSLKVCLGHCPSRQLRPRIFDGALRQFGADRLTRRIATFLQRCFGVARLRTTTGCSRKTQAANPARCRALTLIFHG